VLILLSLGLRILRQHTHTTLKRRVYRGSNTSYINNSDVDEFPVKNLKFIYQGSSNYGRRCLNRLRNKSACWMTLTTLCVRPCDNEPLRRYSYIFVLHINARKVNVSSRRASVPILSTTYNINVEPLTGKEWGECEQECCG
jgi:hypothetical protein